MGPPVEHLADDVRPGLLCHRDDGRRRQPLRHGPLRGRCLPGHAAAGRPDDRGRHGDLQNGQPRPPPLQPDARSEVRDRDGRLHRRRRPVLQVRLPRREGCRPGRAGRRVRARLPAAARSVARRLDADPGQDQGSPASPAQAGQAPAGVEDRRRAAGAAPLGLCRRRREAARVRSPEDHRLNRQQRSH